jgi:hypothetical protein
MNLRNVDAIAGATWVVNGIKLWWRDPRGLGFFGLLLGLIGILPNLVALLAPALLVPIQMLSLLFSALIVVALFYAAREVDEGRSATPAQLLRVLQAGHKTGRLIAGVLLPQLAILVVCTFLLVWMVGVEEIEKLGRLFQEMQAGKPIPTPEALAEHAIGPFLLWLGVSIAVMAAVGLLTFTLLPDMLFGDVGLFRALQRSIRVCLANLPAMLMFAIAISILAASLVVVLPPIGLLLMAVFGQLGAGLLLNVIFIGVLTPIATNALYLGWKQLLGPQGGGDTTTLPSDRVAM